MSQSGLMLGGTGVGGGTGGFSHTGLCYRSAVFSNGGTGVTYHPCGSCLGALVVLGYGALSCVKLVRTRLCERRAEHVAWLCVLTHVVVSSLPLASLPLSWSYRLGPGDIFVWCRWLDIGVEACELHTWNILWFDESNFVGVSVTRVSVPTDAAVLGGVKVRFA